MKMIISDEELKERMRLPLPTLIDGVLQLPDIIIPPELGRPVGGENKDELSKELIALDGAFGLSTQKEIAKIHNSTQTEVSFLSRGFDRSNVDERKVDEDLTSVINQRKYGIIDKATSKLMETLDIFEPSALDQKHLPQAAQQMASVVERLEGRGNIGQSGPAVQFHIYAPRTRHEDQYEVIQVNE